MPDGNIDEKRDAQKAEPQPEEGDGGGEVADRHGQPGINREKYARDMKARDDKIAELQAQLDEKAKTEEGRASLKKELDDLKAEMAGERVAHKLEMAGCRNVKAAKALLDDYDGDVDKLKLNAGPVCDRRSTRAGDKVDQQVYGPLSHQRGQDARARWETPANKEIASGCMSL